MGKSESGNATPNGKRHENAEYRKDELQMASGAAKKIRKREAKGWHILWYPCNIAFQQKGKFHTTSGSRMRCCCRSQVRIICNIFPVQLHAFVFEFR